MSFAQSKQGLQVTYTVEPSDELVERASFVIAFDSAYKTSGLVYVSPT
jgi:hypothetical protein